MSPRRNKPPPKKKDSPVEDKFEAQLQERGITGYVRQAKFIPKRKFAADFYFPDLKLCVEIDGGTYLANSGHTSGAGYESDRSRDCVAILNGILTVRYTTKMVNSQAAVAHLEALIATDYLPLGSGS